MDYEKAYKEALASIRAMLPNWERLSYNGKTFIQDIKHIFPELVESEDEIMRKELIDFLKRNHNDHYFTNWLEKQGQVKESQISQHEIGTCKENDDFLTSEDEGIRKEIISYLKTRKGYTEAIKDPWIAWLEKQKEQSIISHKFNVGDWIVSKWGGIYQIKEVMSGSYNLLCTNNAEEINSITQVDNNSRLLCISDIKKLEKQGEQKLTPVLDIEIPFGAKDSELQEVSYYIPEGFHAEIKDDEVLIKKGKQNPAWSEEDEVMLDKVIERMHKHSAGDEEYLDIYYWLIALKDRVQPQTTWKPSDEQMDMLKKACDEHWEPDGLDPLYTLYQDLKKLKGE